MAAKKGGIVNYMLNRECGSSKRTIQKSEDVALSIGEEKATIPVKNQPCELSGQSRSTFLMAFSSDGNKIASTHGDHTVRVTDTRTGRCTHILTGHPRTPWCIAFHPTSNDILASGCLGGEVRIWDLHGGGSEVWKSSSGFVISSLAFHPVDQVLVFAQGNEIHFWDWRDSQPFAHCKTANDYEKVRWVKFDVWGHHLYTGIANGSTVQRNDSLDEFSYISVPHMNTNEGRRLRDQYNMLVNRMTASQQLRINTAYPPGMSNTQSEIELVEPRSPTHNTFNTQGLNEAFRHADQVTSSRRRALRNAREYAAHVTSVAFQDAARRLHEGASTVAQSSQRYHDGQRSEADSDIPAASSHARSTARQMGLFNLASREPCQPVISLGSSSWQSVASNSSDSIVRNMLLPDFSGPTAVSTANTSRRTSNQNRPRPSGSSLLRSRLCASAASSSPPAPPQSDPSAVAAAVTSAAAEPTTSNAGVTVANSASATATSSGEEAMISTTITNVSATVPSVNNAVSTLQISTSRSMPMPVSNRPSLLRSFLSVPPATSTISASSDRTSTSAVSSSASLVIFSGEERQGVTAAAGGPSTNGMFNFTRNLNAAEPRVTSSRENSEASHTARSNTASNRNDQADEDSSGSPEPGTSCPEQCNICSGMPGVRESFALHRMRNRRRRLAMRCSGLGRRVMRNNPPSAASSSEQAPRERTQTLASYIDSEVRRVLGQQDSQESDSSDSTTERNDTYQQPTTLIIPPRTTSSGNSGHTDAPTNSIGERRRQLYERLRNDVREMENDMRDLRSVMRQRHMEMRMQNLMRYRQRREDRQRRIDERLQLSGGPGGIAGRGRTGPRLSRFQNLSLRAAERQRRNRLHMEDLRAGYRAAIRDVHRQIPEITVTQASPEAEDSPNPLARPLTGETLSQIRRMRADMLEERHAGQLRTEDRSWHSMSRRYLHQHYSTSILDDTINRPEDGIHAAINRAIAGAFMGTGEAAVASNIVSLTHRIQRWDFTDAKLPDITDSGANVIVGHCKLHNDASVDLSQDGSRLAVLVPSPRGFPNDTIMAIFSLTEDTLGQCFYTKSFGPNAISVSISPLNNYVLIGLAAKRLQWVFTPKQMVAQVFKMKTKEAGEDSMEHICDLMHPCDLDIRTHVSVNSARWLPGVGEGIIYGTNRGDLHICRPGHCSLLTRCRCRDDEKDRKDRPHIADPSESNSIRRNLMQMLGIAVPDTISTATQTVHRIRRTASTQTESATNHPSGSVHVNVQPNARGAADQRSTDATRGTSSSWYLPNVPR